MKINKEPCNLRGSFLTFFKKGLIFFRYADIIDYTKDDIKKEKKYGENQ